jgi:hypothetical protein
LGWTWTLALQHAFWISWYLAVHSLGGSSLAIFLPFAGRTPSQCTCWLSQSWFWLRVGRQERARISPMRRSASSVEASFTFCKTMSMAMDNVRMPFEENLSSLLPKSLGWLWWKSKEIIVDEMGCHQVWHGKILLSFLSRCVFERVGDICWRYDWARTPVVQGQTS